MVAGAAERGAGAGGVGGLDGFPGLVVGERRLGQGLLDHGQGASGGGEDAEGGGPPLGRALGGALCGEDARQLLQRRVEEDGVGGGEPAVQVAQAVALEASDLYLRAGSCGPTGFGGGWVGLDHQRLDEPEQPPGAEPGGERGDRRVDPQRSRQRQLGRRAGEAACQPQRDSARHDGLPQPGQPGLKVEQFDHLLRDRLDAAGQRSGQFQTGEVVDRAGAFTAQSHLVGGDLVAVGTHDLQHRQRLLHLGPSFRRLCLLEHAQGSTRIKPSHLDVFEHVSIQTPATDTFIGQEWRSGGCGFTGRLGARSPRRGTRWPPTTRSASAQRSGRR